MNETYVTEEHAKAVCKIGQGAACCRYLTMTGRGWSCEKHSTVRDAINWRVEAGLFTARGDNCEGRLSR